MNRKGMIVAGEIISVLAIVVIFIKVSILKPECLSIVDSYFALVPILFVKIVELMEVFS